MTGITRKELLELVDGKILELSLLAKMDEVGAAYYGERLKQYELLRLVVEQADRGLFKEE